MQKQVKLKQKRRILDDFFKVDEALLSFEKRDGTLSETVRRLSFERGDSVAILIFAPTTRKMLLVNQFKYPTLDKGPGWITELVAGMIDGGESSEDAAQREILEEVGYQPSKLLHVSTFYVSPGGSSERVSLYYASVTGSERTAAGGGLLSEGEDIETIEMGLDEALAAIEKGDICDAKTILAIYWLREYLRQNPNG